MAVVNLKLPIYIIMGHIWDTLWPVDTNGWMTKAWPFYKNPPCPREIELNYQIVVHVNY